MGNDTPHDMHNDGPRDLDYHVMQAALELRVNGNQEDADALESCMAYLREAYRGPIRQHGTLADALTVIRDNADAALKAILEHQAGRR